MPRTYITPQKVHSILRKAGVQKEVYKPSKGINKQGYYLSNGFKHMLLINPCKPLGQSVEMIIDILSNAGIQSKRATDKKGVEVGFVQVMRWQ